MTYWVEALTVVLQWVKYYRNTLIMPINTVSMIMPEVVDDLKIFIVGNPRIILQNGLGFYLRTVMEYQLFTSSNSLHMEIPTMFTKVDKMGVRCTVFMSLYQFLERLTCRTLGIQSIYEAVPSERLNYVVQLFSDTWQSAHKSSTIGAIRSVAWNNTYFFVHLSYYVNCH